jgi:DNA-binding transcriptional LysR family regulator
MNSFPWYATELFLGVCDAGGLSAASRFGKAGISQPALSGQMMALEKHLGVSLFERRPFRLTPEGIRFREEAIRLLARMNRLRESLSGASARPLRVAASDVVIRDYLPELLRQMDTASRTRLVLTEAPSQDLPGLVRDDEADIAVGVLSRHARTGGSPLVEIIASLPLIVMIPPSHRSTVKQWADLLRLLRQKEQPGLITLPQSNLLTGHIHSSLRKSGVEWHPTLEVSSLSHVSKYVELDFGFGFEIKAPHTDTMGKKLAIMEVPTQRIAAFKLGVWHRERLDPLAVRLIKLIRAFARENLR